MSLIFKPSEMRALNNRLSGDKSDPNGTYAGRVKPKIKELLEWTKRSSELRRLIK